MLYLNKRALKSIDCSAKMILQFIKGNVNIDNCFSDDRVSKTLCSYFKMFSCNNLYWVTNETMVPFLIDNGSITHALLSS